MAWDGEDDWVRIADSAKTALTDDNLAWTASSTSFWLDTRRAADVMLLAGSWRTSRPRPVSIPAVNSMTRSTWRLCQADGLTFMTFHIEPIKIARYVAF
jgi:hypothetical protein